MASDKKSFKETLNLPKTDFPIRPNPHIEDAALLKRWQQEDLYHKTFIHNEGNTKFIFHDGPPYANGHIHLGSAYNKILKDIACKAQRMTGKQVPVTPGWDCHGMPIEQHVTKEHPGLTRLALMDECRAYAQKWIDIQRKEFKDLGILFDWGHPYLTMDPAYEAKILYAFADFVDKGYIAKKAKTVPWCPTCQTVLASAEIEYKERKDPSIYVTFTLAEKTAHELFPSLKDKPISFLIWTTTPWTLPLNRAILLHPNARYQVLAINGRYVIVGAPLADKISALLGVEKNVVAEVPATVFEGINVQHPFITNVTVPIILDQSVSLSEGTACVHCAPGCGPEDYDIAVKHNMDIYSPITRDGRYADDIEPKALAQMPVSDGQGWVITQLKTVDALLHKESIKHAYPHCWRCHSGLIFRATRQWFLDLAHKRLKEKALDAIEAITFLPKRSKNFLKATIQGRLEWCISRQRIWGVPIPAVLCTQCDHPFVDARFVTMVADNVQEYGIEYWQKVTLEELGVHNWRCPHCHGTTFKKEFDILDVWFDSGVSHYAVLYHNNALGYPADLYLEGIDQHRGWFQSSLLTSLVLEEQAAMHAILTHGFTVDQKGHKMSKSLGNVVTPDDLIKRLGTDGLRLWVSSIDLGSDAVVSETLLKNVQEVYRKIRNTARFLLSNLYDFNYQTDGVALPHLLPIDRYALEYLFQVNLRLRAAYERFDFTAVFHELADYCAKELSSFYLDIIKDRLYCSEKASKERRAAQTACLFILDTLTRLIAPILSFTAEQIADHYQKEKTTSIHLQDFAHLQEVWTMMTDQNELETDVIDWYPFKAPAYDAAEKIKRMSFYVERSKQWDLLQAIRSALLRAIEEQREQNMLKHSLEAKVIVHFDLPANQATILNDFLHDVEKTSQTVNEFFKEFLIISQFSIQKNTRGLTESPELPGLWFKVEHAEGAKCPRCWQWEKTEHPDGLCTRCSAIIGSYS